VAVRATRVFVAVAILGTAIMTRASPWTEKHEGAVVRIEVPLQGTAIPQVAAGFIVSGEDKRYYVLTASHGIVSTVVPEAGSDCKALPVGMRMFRGKKNGPEVFGSCVIHIGLDTALIELQPPQGPLTYPRLELNGREPKRHELLYYGGFPFGIDFFVDRKAEVSAVNWPPDGWTATEANPAKGMSGGPYLESEGTVVGLHHGQASEASGWGVFVPVSLLRASLEKFVRPIVIGSAPTPVPPSPNCSATTIAKAFRYVHPSQRATLYGALCNPADPQVSELLQYVPYEPPPSQVATAASPPFPPPLPSVTSAAVGLPSVTSPTFGVPSITSPAFGLPSITSPAFGLPSVTTSLPALDPELVGARIRGDLKLSETSCLEEANVTVLHNLLNCQNRGQFIPSPNVGGVNTPVLIVVHSTSTTSAQSTINVLTSKEFRASAHVLIERDGSFVQLVPFNRAAWHAGPGKWEGLTGLNNKSIGLELINAGKLTRSDDGKFKAAGGAIIPESQVQMVNGQPWHRYTAEQFAATVAIGKALAKAYEISGFVGHCDIMPGRKLDPGPAFPTGQIEGYVLNIPTRRAACPNS
jgi:N-acetylmuramoyl-L-alanine amidase